MARREKRYGLGDKARVLEGFRQVGYSEKPVVTATPYLSNIDPILLGEDDMPDEFGLHRGERWRVISAFTMGGHRLCRGDFLTDAQAEMLMAPRR